MSAKKKSHIIVQKAKEKSHIIVQKLDNMKTERSYCTKCGEFIIPVLPKELRWCGESIELADKELFFLSK